MLLAVAVLGVLVAALCLYGVARPRELIRVVSALPAERRVPVMASVRAAMGIVLIVAAPDTAWPRSVAAIGALALVAAVVLVLLGCERVDAIVHWWTGAPAAVIRAWALLGVGFGAFLAMAALRGGGAG
jgi:hypothetical protein